MTITSQIEKPDDVPVTISATMTLAEWKKLKSVINAAYDREPIAFHLAIYDAITQVEQKIFQQAAYDAETGGAQ